MTALQVATQAGRDAWNRYGIIETRDEMAVRYSNRWAAYRGTIFNEAWRKSPFKGNHRMYANTRLLLKHVEAVVDFYSTTVYQGDLSLDGQPLSDGSLGAIPIDPQVDSPDNLLTAISTLFSEWNWRENMNFRPTMAAALGDCLTELIDDDERGFVWPQPIWPGYVKNLELDQVGNLRYYELEYSVVEQREDGGRDHYRYNKIVTPEEFRYFKNGQPFDYYGNGAVVSNPYGFVPAVWDRHESDWDERGYAAVDGTMQALFEVNSLLSQSFDFQRKVFITPIFIKGLTKRRKQERMQIGKAPEELSNEEAMEDFAERVGVVPITGENPQLLQPTFDLGQTIDIIKMIQDGILDENPEARFYKELRAMSTLTGPGAERALGDAVSRCNRVRARSDTQTIKLVQMAISMLAFRANDEAWGPENNTRMEPFAQFDLNSYKEGLTKFTILSRPVIPMTQKERLELIQITEGIQSDWGMEEAGLDVDDRNSLRRNRQTTQRQVSRGLTTGAILP